MASRLDQQRQAIESRVASDGMSMTAALLDRAKAQFATIPSVFNDLATAEPGTEPGSLAEQVRFEPGVRTSNDSWAAAGLADNVPRSLIQTESSGNWGASNGLGYHGLLQFGPARFQDAVKAGVVPQGMTLQQFGTDTPEGRAAQVAVANWHFDDIDRRIKAKGYDKLIGQVIGGTPITWDGMRAMAHLGGFGGLSSFLGSNGAYNPADAYGTSLSAYGRTHQ